MSHLPELYFMQGFVFALVLVAGASMLWAIVQTRREPRGSDR